MTVVNPKSISGINSITTGSGSDNLLTIHTSDASNTERVRINSSGDVIVGSGITVSPDGDIFATGVTTATTFVGNLTGDVTGTASQVTIANGSNDRVITAASANTLNGESNFTYDSSNVARLVKATVGAAKTTVPLILDNNAGGGDGTNPDVVSLGFAAQGTTKASIRADVYGNGNLAFHTNNDTEKVRITAAGRVGINAISPDAKLEVRDSGATGIIIRSTNTQSTDTNKAIRVRNNSDTDTFAVSHTGKVFPLDNVVMAAGKGIDFSATSDGPSVGSELFDDYEEGSYTPVVTYSGTTYTYGASNDYTLRSPHSNANNNSIAYTKIGSMVFLNFTIFWNQSYTNRYVISLPFTARGSAYALCTTPASFQVDIDGDSLGTLGTGNNSTGFDTFRILKDTSTGGHGNVPLTASSEVYYMISYEAL